MDRQKPFSPSPHRVTLHDFTLWEPILRLLLASSTDRRPDRSTRVAGRIGLQSWSLALRRPSPPPGRASQIEDMREEFDAVGRVQGALAAAGIDDIAFAAEISPTGRTALHLLGPSPAVEPGIGNPHPGALILVEGALPEPWRRLPEPVPGVVPAASADPLLLERTLRERLPDAIGATEAEIAAAEARLGVTLPAELTALYRVTRARWADWGDDHEKANRVFAAVGCELLPLDELYLADAQSRYCRWEFAAMEAAVGARPGAAVQGLVGSPGWIAFGDNGGGDRLAIDLTPGPGGHVGQIIILNHEDNIGAALLADSLTDLVLDRSGAEGDGPHDGTPSPVAHVNIRSLTSIEAAAHPGLEVLSIGVWDDEPLSLAPVAGLPRLRTLSAYPGTLADPLEIVQLTGLEYLALGPQDWRALLDAGAVPRSLSAAAIEVRGPEDPLFVVAVANELLALWDRPRIEQTVIEGELGPVG
ncbi:SMI1/KNR4 family protein [Kitasatospora sp. NPDC089509]|uniref:SMI1/KNR4 family protein n=1 Tax=Kitasatospora sp. NPDC089509 TaxID=3364079 RepID=UPI003825A00E